MNIPVTIYETMEHADLINFVSSIDIGHTIKSSYIESMDIKVINGYAYKVYQIGG